LSAQELRKGSHTMIRQLLSAAIFVVSSVSFLYSQTVALNSPAAWSTLRTDSVVAKAQIDTAGMKRKQVDYTLSSVIGGVTKVIIKKQVKVTDVSNDAFLAKLNSSVLGGTDYLKVEWSADSQKGEILPFGIVDLGKLPKIAPIQAKMVDDGATLKGIGEALKDEQFNKCGARSFALNWNSKALYIIIKKTSDSSELLFGLDGKNGKNAFVAYPDRFIVSKKDSVWGAHFNREIVNAVLKYSPLSWNNEITKEVVGDKIVVRMPWYDTGIVPFDGRIIGFGAFSKDKEKIIASNPEKAKEFIPGTWGNLLLVK
jgi:hypothetical protein